MQILKDMAKEGWGTFDDIYPRLAAIEKNKPYMYEFNIRANPNEFLDWDKPLSQQAVYDPVRHGLGKRMIDATDEMRGSDVVRELQKHYGQNWKSWT